MISRRLTWPLGLGVVLAVVAVVYGPTVNDYFGGDDFLVIGPVHNSGPWNLIAKSIMLRDDIPYWRPLVSPLYAFEVRVFWLRPWAYHVVALGLHLTNVALLAALAVRLTGRRGVGLAAGLIFGIHAAHTTTVAQISSTVELLSVVWYATTVLCAVIYVTGGGRRWYWFTVGAFVLALLSKESAASAAGVITVLFFVYVFLPKRRAWPFLRDILPFWALVIPYIVLTYRTDTADPSGIVTRMYFPGGHVGQNMWWFLTRLAAPFETGQGPHVTAIGHIGAAALLLVAAVLVVRGTRRERFLVAWVAIALTPLAPWRPELLLGRFTYQASAPYAILLALGGAWAAEWLGRAAGARRLDRIAGPALLVVAVVVFAPLTAAQNRERAREGDDYRVLVSALQREYPRLPPGSEVELLDGIWPGPFHALYLDAVASTLYGAGRVRIVNVAPGDAPAGVSPAPIRLRYRGGMLVHEAPLP